MPINIRDFGATRHNGNSIFVFEMAGLCIAHLGHLQQLKPKIALPMHFFSETTLARFLARAGEDYQVRRLVEPRVVVSRNDLPPEPEVLVLPGR